MAHKILDVAESFTQTHGFNAFSYKDIQAEVGVKTSSIHYYFPTKQDLAVAMTERYTDRFLQLLNDIDEKHSKASIKLAAVGQIFVDLAKTGKLCLCCMLSSDILSIPQEGLEKLRIFFKETEAWITKIIMQGIEDGDFKSSLQTKNAAAYFLATLEGGILLTRVHKNASYMKIIATEAMSHLTG